METAINPASNPSPHPSLWTWPIRIFQWVFVIPLVCVIFWVPLLFVIVPILVVNLVWAVGFLIVHGRQERQFRETMQAMGRFIAWSDLEPNLIAGRGTLIIEQANKVGARIWWSPDDLVARSPFEIPASDALNYFGPEEKPNPFVLWCREQFLDETHGTAFLTEHSLELPPGLGFAGFFGERYPGLSAVDTVLPFKGEGKPKAIDELA